MKCRFPLTVLMRKKEKQPTSYGNKGDGFILYRLILPSQFETLCSHQLYVFDLRCRIFEHANQLLFIITKHRLWAFGVNGFPPQNEFQSQKLLQFRS